MSVTARRFAAVPCFCSVQVDQVQPLGSRLNPASRHGGRIVAEDRFAVVVALLESDAFTVAKVYCGPDLHRHDVAEWFSKRLTKNL